MKRRLVLVPVAACAVVLAGCSSTLDPFASAPDVASAGGIPEPESTDAGFPLPEDAEIEYWGTVAADDIDTDDLEGTLAPDDAEPAERVPEILERGRIRIGVDQAQNRLSYRNPLTGALEGFEVELGREIARDIFGDPDAVDFRFVSSPERTEVLRNDVVDLIIRTTTITADRQEEMQFSAPYLEASTRMLVHENSGIEDYSDLPGLRVCASAGSTTLDRVRTLAPNSDILKVTRWPDCLLALQQRQVEAIITDDTILAGMADQDPSTHIVGEPASNEHYGIAIRHPSDTEGTDAADGSAGLVRQVNDTLERIDRDGTWQRLYNEWFGGALAHATMPAPDYREEPDNE